MKYRLILGFFARGFGQALVLMGITLWCTVVLLVWAVRESLIKLRGGSNAVT